MKSRAKVQKVFTLLAMAGISLTACGGAPVKVIVSKDLENRKTIKHEVLEAFEFYCQERKLDCDLFGEGVRIFVVPADWNCRHGSYVGMCAGQYWPGPKEVYISWRGGVHQNALFHELLHRELYLAGYLCSDYRCDEYGAAAHTKDFIRIADGVKKNWACDKNIVDSCPDGG